MKILVDDIPETGLTLDLSEDGKDIEALAASTLDFSLISPVAAHLSLTKADRNVYISGDINTRVRANCSRCLKEFEHDVRADFSVFYVSGKEEGREVELKAADMDVQYFEGPDLDTNEILLAQLALEMPMQELCKSDCVGLCPKCGADLNQGTCKCSSEAKVDPRFAKLKDFKVK